MRLGKLHDRERIGRGYPSKAPEYSSRGLRVGSLSSNVINSIYIPMVEEIAILSLEDYANQLVEYEEALKVTAQPTTGDEGDEEATLIRPLDKEDLEPPPRPYFHSEAQIAEVKEMMEDTAKEFSKLNKWKVWAKAAKFERQLDERYGVFRPFVKEHPEIERFVRSIQRKYAMGFFSPIRSKPAPLSKSTTIILLFMMQRNKVDWKLMCLTGLFLLVGLQPWALVLLLAIGNTLSERRRKRPFGKMKNYMETVSAYYHKEDTSESIPLIEEEIKNHKESFLKKPVGTKLKDEETVDVADYDTMILGSGAGTLYTAALLSRAGRKVLVLSGGDDASGCLTLSGDHLNDARFQQVPFDVEASNVSRISKQQELLAPALMTTTDYQGGVRFAQIGTEADGYAFEVLLIPGMGGALGKDDVPFILRAAGGLSTLMDDATRYLGDGWADSDGGIGNSLSGTYLGAVSNINTTASSFYMSKILDEKTNGFRSKTAYGEASLRYTEPFLNKCFPLNAHLRSLFSGMGMKGENLPPGKTSMAAHVTNVCATMSGEGMHYPLGGPRALCHALANVVEKSGGRVVTHVQTKELVFGKPPKGDAKPKRRKKKDTSGKQKEQDPECPRCLGVKLMDDRIIAFAEAEKNKESDKAVVSMNGFIDTFIRLLPDDFRQEFKVPRGLPALAERRPLLKILFALDGSASELDLTGADTYRLPAAALPQDYTDPTTGKYSFGEIGGSSLADKNSEESEVSKDLVNAPAAESSAERAGGSSSNSSAKIKTKRNKYYPGASWMHITFPSAKDPSFEYRHGKITTCVVTIEADDDFVIEFDTKPKLFSPNKTPTEGVRLKERVTRDLLENFPQLEGKIVHSELRGPFSKGLSHTPERFAANGIRADTPYPGLFMGGPDLAVGDSFAGSIVAGWLTANAVVGYSALDILFLNKHITNDLKLFTEEPYEEEDVAVPYTAQKSAVEDVEASIDQVAGEDEGETKKDK